MLHIVLYEPEIPANTGNIIRLCANAGMHLHLIKPLGFDLDDKKLRRAGLDYHEWVAVKEHDSLADFTSSIKPGRLFALSTKGRKLYSEVSFQSGDALLFGPETRGLPAEVLAELGAEQCVYLPMQAASRSLNLSNTVAIVLYEAWRQLDFSGAVIK
ncbi:MAG: tRNA (uridine(34)/cytosine(34)/5-carboxymethylaminomethyluridine(34)-2'-O)-methyltransferase TrmL [Methylobacter sp.]|nr:tRNA (uridine(34)/cytosine(34)/5-carboxymethylaminomethyluridine(34)-2'-O)-methyltransferase TrmL [Methylobacter sp.]MDP2428573.1 tRNA (uridine(34)/cytosine(34)/5-carboxymethylaminomethyluridine(34)-2'-O)-methyltransferase TrmL [Methylobacter sp.]MDP3056409.1 tRNA (uridine(34)/cytosine(34)/5-carboxymethylaminomethyluridine(34)-2'-O)-methyltransferase TrmL [Methylobacter sp.]MDP3363155.1 tRNA (uridine(34)/cytosine(34)/5-carboxymethylaminomethyluridine(34)-2'-O)-methyltransferase TrmL [Methylob